MTPTVLSSTRQSHRDALRDATRQAHDAAERRWFSTSAFASVADYLRWLSAMARVHDTIGQAAAKRLADPAILQAEAQRSKALQLDLPDREQDETVFHQPLSTSHAWGALYVLNGSAMGASMLMKPGTLPKAWPRAYLAAMKSYATSGQLKAFYGQLNHADLNMAEATAGASEVFDALASAS